MPSYDHLEAETVEFLSITKALHMLHSYFTYAQKEVFIANISRYTIPSLKYPILEVGELYRFF